MPGLTIKNFLIPSLFCCGMAFAAENETTYSVPSDQAQVSFGAQTTSPERQLQKVAEGFAGGATGNSEEKRVVAPSAMLQTPQFQAATHRSPVVTASMGQRDTTSIQQASATEKKEIPSSAPAEPNAAEPQPSPEKPLAEPLPLGKHDGDLLDMPISLKHSATDANGKLKRPGMSVSVAPLVSVFGSLLVVLSAFLLLVFLLKRVSPKGNRALPKEVFENLGRTFLTQKLQLHLLRLGNRLILVSVTADGVSPVTEITDPDEVVPLLGMCRRLDANSSTELFQKTLAGFSQEKSEDGYFGTDAKPKGKVQASKHQLDLYSDSEESLADLLASGLPKKGGSRG